MDWNIFIKENVSFGGSIKYKKIMCMFFYVLSYFFAESFLSEKIWRMPSYNIFGLLIEFTYFLSWVVYYLSIVWILFYLFLYYPIHIYKTSIDSIDSWFLRTFRSLLSLPILLYFTFILYFTLTYFLYAQEICNYKTPICLYANDSMGLWFLVLWMYILIILPICIFLYCLFYALILLYYKRWKNNQCSSTNSNTHK